MMVRCSQETYVMKHYLSMNVYIVGEAIQRSTVEPTINIFVNSETYTNALSSNLTASMMMKALST